MVLLWVSTLRFSYFKTKYMGRPTLKNIYPRLRFYTFNLRGIKLKTSFWVWWYNSIVRLFLHKITYFMSDIKWNTPWPLVLVYYIHALKNLFVLGKEKVWKGYNKLYITMFGYRSDDDKRYDVSYVHSILYTLWMATSRRIRLKLTTAAAARNNSSVFYTPIVVLIAGFCWVSSIRHHSKPN